VGMIILRKIIPSSNLPRNEKELASFVGSSRKEYSNQKKLPWLGSDDFDRLF
jgi:hypothetical protein